jgi:predicted  nucleic acid-binding Zn-ribbon protein
VTDSRINSLQNEVARQAEEITKLSTRIERYEEWLDQLFQEIGIRRLSRRPLKVRA